MPNRTDKLAGGRLLLTMLRLLCFPIYLRVLEVSDMKILDLRIFQNWLFWTGFQLGVFEYISIPICTYFQWNNYCFCHSF